MVMNWIEPHGHFHGSDIHGTAHRRLLSRAVSIDCAMELLQLTGQSRCFGLDVGIAEHRTRLVGMAQPCCRVHLHAHVDKQWIGITADQLHCLDT